MTRRNELFNFKSDPEWPCETMDFAVLFEVDVLVPSAVGRAPLI